MSGGSDQSAVENEQADGSRTSGTDDASGDGDGELAAGVEQKARAAAERATGGVANGDVEPAGSHPSLIRTGR